MNSKNDKSDFSHFYSIGGGVVFGYWLSTKQSDAAKRSRAEIDDPELSEDACDVISELLESWEPEENCETEADFTHNLAQYLEEQCDFEIEVFPNSPEGKPDVLVGDVLALELKVGLGKAQRDRLIGQCAGYSRLWVTWAIVFNASESELGRLVDLLEDKDLEYIAVWGY